MGPELATWLSSHSRVNSSSCPAAKVAAIRAGAGQVQVPALLGRLRITRSTPANGSFATALWRAFESEEILGIPNSDASFPLGGPGGPRCTGGAPLQAPAAGRGSGPDRLPERIENAPEGSRSVDDRDVHVGCRERCDCRTGAERADSSLPPCWESAAIASECLQDGYRSAVVQLPVSVPSIGGRYTEAGVFRVAGACRNAPGRPLQFLSAQVDR